MYYNYQTDILSNMQMSILPYDDSIIGGMNSTQLAAYEGNSSLYSIVPFRVKTAPADSWAIPVVTGHKYKVHWGYGLDWM